MDYLYVNTTRSNSLTIDFDLSFPDLACGLLSVDVMDDAGISQNDAVHDVYKHRLGPEGERVGHGERIELGNTVRTEAQLEAAARESVERAQAVIKQQIGDCGNCYGAGRKGECCNTCQQVKEAYARLGWRFKPQGIIQCNSEAMMVNLQEQYAEDGGCQIYGRLSLNKAAGHFHIAPHRKLHQPQLQGGAPGQPMVFNLMDLISFTFDQFNVTHTINSLSFGEQYPGIQSPLDGQYRRVADTHGMYQYYVKVVPTKYRDQSGRTVESNQYAFTEHLSHLAPGSGRGLPGVYFHYEVSPIQALIEEKPRGSLLRFLTSVCAIVGGAYSVMGLVDLVLSKLFYSANLL